LAILCGALLLFGACNDDETGGNNDAAVDAARIDGRAADAARDLAKDIAGDLAQGDDLAGDISVVVDAAAADGPLPMDASASCVHPAVTQSCTDGWCVIPAGCFLMSNGTHCSISLVEVPHEVTLSKAFVISATEVTQQQFQDLMSYNPSDHTGCPSCPVEQVSWDEAAAYCNALSDEADQCYECNGTQDTVSCPVKAAFAGDQIYDCAGYRLPTEAEWEYAYRAGTGDDTYSGPLSSCSSSDVVADRIAWYAGNAGGATHEAEGKAANAWGLYDMPGNVWEWCHDFNTTWTTDPETDPVGTGTDHPVRGGAYNTPPINLRAADRSNLVSGVRAGDVGFRCVRKQ
jgi:formylglycine-generating enzyme required for sulfatase activity